MPNEEATRLTVTLSRETDLALRAFAPPSAIMRAPPASRARPQSPGVGGAS